MQVKDRIASLREAMTENYVDAFVVYSADPHMSEYLPEEWKERAWISGFTGSAGFVVILKDKAGLWTDGRYFTQAPIQLEGSGIDLFKDGVEGTPHYIDWILSEIPKGGTIAVNAMVASHANWSELQTKAEKAGAHLKSLSLIHQVWKNREASPKNKIFVHPLAKAGQSVQDKIALIRSKMKEKGVNGHLISSLDDVAWTLNLRGSDVECNPVFLGYIYISLDEVVLFADRERMTDEAIEEMEKWGVVIHAYEDFYKYISSLRSQNILISPAANQAIFEAVKKDNQIVKDAVIGNIYKAVKNSTELEGFRSAMVKDGVAMVNFLHWLTKNVGKEKMNEYQIGEKLLTFRAAQRDFVNPSFGSIVGYKGNGAIIHYSAPENGSAEVYAEGSILVDSGGQYLEGTTDITRTLPLGEVSEEFKRDVTLVLKGMIRLSMVKFPKGTCGVHLDSWARMALWQEGKDYNHGTGHGVGSFMNVHEGPQNIRKDLNATILQEGMVLSNEPGYYLENKYGIRHENLVAVKKWKTTEWNTFYEFETLTICPFFKSIIVKELLSEEEINWLNNYHKMCEEKLSPFLEGEVKEWFLEMVKPMEF